jgi:hypothetical protein
MMFLGGTSSDKCAETTSYETSPTGSVVGRFVMDNFEFESPCKFVDLAAYTT